MSGAHKEESKIRLIAVAKMVNEGRKVTSKEIMRRLELQYDIQADRKTIYSDIAAIDRFIPIQVMTGKKGGFKKWRFEDG